MVDICKSQLANQFTTATHCNTLQHAATRRNKDPFWIYFQVDFCKSQLTPQYPTCNVNLRHAMSIYDMQCQFTTCNGRANDLVETLKHRHCSHYR